MVRLTPVQQNYRRVCGLNAPVRSQKPGLLSRIGNWLNLGPSLATPNGLTLRSNDFDLQKVAYMATMGGGPSVDPKARLLVLFEGLEINSRQIRFIWKGEPDLFFTITLVGAPSSYVLDGGGLYPAEENAMGVRMLGHHGSQFRFSVAGLEGINPLGSFVFRVQKDGRLDIDRIQGFNVAVASESEEDTQEEILTGFSNIYDVRITSVGAEEIDFEWAPVAGANAYEVQAKYFSGQGHAEPKIVTETKYPFKGLQPTTWYRLSVAPLVIDPQTKAVLQRGQTVEKEIGTGKLIIPPLENIKVISTNISSAEITFNRPSRASRCLCRLFKDENKALVSNPHKIHGNIALWETEVNADRLVIPDLDPDTTYYVALHPNHDLGFYGDPQVVSISTKPVILKQVTGLRIVNTTARGGDLSWLPVENATGYELNVFPRDLAINFTSATDQITINTLLPASEYSIQVRAIYKKGKERPGYFAAGEPSEAIPLKTLALSAPKAKVDKLSAGSKFAKAELSWEAVSGASFYELAIADSEQALSRLMTFQTISLTSFPLKELEPGKPFCFKVRARVSGAAPGEWSAIVPFETPLTERQLQQAARAKSAAQSATLREQQEAARQRRQAIRDAEKATSEKRQADEARLTLQTKADRNKKARIQKAFDIAAQTTDGWFPVGKILYKIQAVLEYYKGLQNKKEIMIGTKSIRDEIQALITQIIDGAGLKEEQKQKAMQKVKGLFDQYVRN